MSVFDLLGEGMQPRVYQPGQLIYLQSTEADLFYYLRTGSVRSFISLSNGEERLIKIHHSGDLMGEASFFDQCPRVTSAMAVTECEVFAITREKLDDVFVRHPDLAQPMLQYLARTVRILSHHVNDASLPCVQRIARYLLIHTSNENCSIAMTHEELGQAIGASRVTVSRALRTLTEAGAVSTGYGQVRTLDRFLLRSIASE